MVITVKSKKNLATGKKAANLFYWGIVALPVLQFLVFYVGVNFNSILLSFQKYDNGKFIWFGFGNFEAFISDLFNGSILKTAFSNSLKVYFWTLIIGTPTSILFSYYIFKRRPASTIFRILLFLPSIVSVIVLVLMYKYFVERAFPPLVNNLFHITLEGLLVRPDIAMTTIIVFLVWSSFGMGTVLYTGAMSGIDNSIIESGQIDGITPLKEIWYIIIPMIYPTLTLFLVTGIAGFFTSQAALYSFFASEANYGLYTYGYYFFIKVVGDSSSISNFPYSAAAGIIFTLIAAPVTLLAKYFLEKFGPNSEY